MKVRYMNWDAIKAGYGAALLFMIPFFLGMVWALLNEKHGVLVALLCGWLITGNIAFFRAYNKKKADVTNNPKD